MASQTRTNQDDLFKELVSDREQLRQLRADIAGGKVKNVREARRVKKIIAVINTLIKEKDGVK